MYKLLRQCCDNEWMNRDGRLLHLLVTSQFSLAGNLDMVVMLPMLSGLRIYTCSLSHIVVRLFLHLKCIIVTQTSIVQHSKQMFSLDLYYKCPNQVCLVLIQIRVFFNIA